MVGTDEYPIHQQTIDEHEDYDAPKGSGGGGSSQQNNNDSARTNGEDATAHHDEKNATKTVEDPHDEEPVEPIKVHMNNDQSSAATESESHSLVAVETSEEPHDEMPSPPKPDDDEEDEEGPTGEPTPKRRKQSFPDYGPPHTAAVGPPQQWMMPHHHPQHQQAPPYPPPPHWMNHHPPHHHYPYQHHYPPPPHHHPGSNNTPAMSTYYPPPVPYWNAPPHSELQHPHDAAATGYPSHHSHHHLHPGMPPPPYHPHPHQHVQPTIDPHQYQEFLAWQQSNHSNNGANNNNNNNSLHVATAKPETMGATNAQHWMTSSSSPPAKPEDLSVPLRFSSSHNETAAAPPQRKQSQLQPRRRTSNTTRAHHPLRSDEPQETVVPPLNTAWADLCENAVLVCPALRGDVTDALYVAMAQFQPTPLTVDDRIGKMKQRPLGYTGICCKFCAGQPGFGRYFPGSYDSFLNGTNCAGIVRHLLQECTACPRRVRETVEQLSRDETNPHGTSSSSTTTRATKSGPVRPRYGSRKRFFSYVWNKLRHIDKNPAATATTATALTKTNNSDNHLAPVEQPPDDDKTAENDNEASPMIDPVVTQWVKDSSLVVLALDRHLVPDITLIAMAQMKVCRLLPDDKVGRCKEHPLGFKGLCCKFCGGKSGKPGYGRYFPSSLRSLAQADSCQQMIKHYVSGKCPACPTELRQELVARSSSSSSSTVLSNSKNESTNTSTTTGNKRVKYGSRIIFFRRIWERLHGGDNAVEGDNDEDKSDQQTIMKQEEDESNNLSASTDGSEPNRGSDKIIDGDNQEAPKTANSTSHAPGTTEIDWDRLLGDNPGVVTMEDKGLVAESQWAAIAQMKPCHLTEADRIGWFKNRPLEFGGLCCKWCGGRPSFGRYFPNSVRSLAQTTSSQTMMSHITLYCRECPDQIRTWIEQLQQREQTDVVASSSTYGSRKVFFDRVWGRIHIGGEPLTGEANCTNDDDDCSGGANNGDADNNNMSTPIDKGECQVDMEAEDIAVPEVAAILPAQDTTAVATAAAVVQVTLNNNDSNNQESTASADVECQVDMEAEDSAVPEVAAILPAQDTTAVATVAAVFVQETLSNDDSNNQVDTTSADVDAP